MTFELTKDPQSVVDIGIDWGPTMSESSPNDTISTSTWAANNGLVIDSDSETTTTTTVWVSAGTRHKYASLVNTIVTAGGRTHERTITVKLQDR